MLFQASEQTRTERSARHSARVCLYVCLSVRLSVCLRIFCANVTQQTGESDCITTACNIARKHPIASWRAAKTLVAYAIIVIIRLSQKPLESSAGRKLPVRRVVWHSFGVRSRVHFCV